MLVMGLVQMEGRKDYMGDGLGLHGKTRGDEDGGVVC